MAWVPRASEVDGTRASAAPQDGQTGVWRVGEVMTPWALALAARGSDQYHRPI